MIKQLIHQDRDLLKKMEFRVGSVEVTLQETSNELQEMKPHLTHLIAQVKDLYRKAEANSSDQNRYIPLEEGASLRKQNNELEKQVDELTKQLAESTMNITTVTIDKEVTILREEKSKLECENSDLMKSIDHGVNRHNDLLSHNDKLQLENKQLQELLRRATSESCIDEIKRELEQCKARNKALEYELTCTNPKDLKRLEKELIVLEQRNYCLELDFEKARAQIEDLNHNNAFLRQANSKLESARECTISKNDELQAHVSQLTEKTEEQQTQIDSLLETTGMFSADRQKDLLADFDPDLKLEKQRNEENANDEKVSICFLYDKGIWCNSKYPCLVSYN